MAKKWYTIEDGPLDQEPVEMDRPEHMERKLRDLEGGTPVEHRSPEKFANRASLEIPQPLLDFDARMKTMEAAMTDVMRRLKALEEKVVG